MSICVTGGSGVVLPLFGDAEHGWPREIRIVLYLLGLAWCFCGVAIIADVFMGAIEKVTSQKTRVYSKSKSRYYTYEVWNPTVANLTLMALGSSAPEILLNLIDIFTKGFFLEGLGPSTIVGSAAFNLLMIIAVCILAIPDDQVKLIKELPVYICTASWSVFAYVWLIIILVVRSPNVIEVWEGALSFLFFPMLVGMAFAADKGILGGRPRQEHGMRLLDRMTPEEWAAAEAEVRKEYNREMTMEQVAKILAALHPPPASRALRRRSATRALMGTRRTDSDAEECEQPTMMQRIGSFKGNKKVVPHSCVVEDIDEPGCFMQFKVEKYAVLESVGELFVKVLRLGGLESTARVRYCTEDGEAKQNRDYEKAEGELVFGPGVQEMEIRLKIVDDAAYESDERFYVALSDARSDSGAIAVVGEISRMTIVIIDDDDAGVLSFSSDTMTLEQKAEDYVASILVQRSCGSCGQVSVTYRTEADTATPGRDYEHAAGVLHFEDKQSEAYIDVMIRGMSLYEKTDKFRVLLLSPTGGAKLHSERDGGPEKNILTVMIEADQNTKERIDQVKNMVLVKWDKSKVSASNWGSQLREAIYVNGGCSSEDDPPGALDYLIHIFTSPWKILFALVPPTDYCGGWLCFFCALVMIGLVTMIIGDVASLLGCVMCIPDEITAITFVALGTSLPDTFASKSAAKQDEFADASVGNVTGSNSVNVFLGLGLPWMIAAVKWALSDRSEKWHSRYQDFPDLDFLGPAGSRVQGFVVPAGSLAFSVTIFSISAVMCLMLLFVRRMVVGGELGGPRVSKYLSAAFLTLIWVSYIVLSAKRTLDELGGAPSGACVA